MEFSREEISQIDKNLGYVVFDWAKHLVQHVIGQAKSSGVSKLYINTQETLDAGAVTEGKTEYFYKKLPQLLGFSLENTNLRGKGPETLWVVNLGTQASKSLINMVKLAQSAPEKQFSLQQIPSKYQGAFISSFGRKPFYTGSEVQQVIAMVEKRSQNKKPGNTGPKFYYDWSGEWSGAQRFHKKINETVVLQKLPQSTQNFILSNPSLLKFWSYLLSQPSHFGSDAIGFALVSKISKDIWVINEIQTDVINQYLNLRNSYKRDNSKPSETMSWETLSDMLDAQNRSNWIPKLQANEAFRNQVLNNPNIIQQLPDNSVDIDKWIAEQQAGGMAGRQELNLIENYSNKTIIISSITKTTKKIKISKKMWEEAGRKNKWI